MNFYSLYTLYTVHTSTYLYKEGVHIHVFTFNIVLSVGIF